MRQPSLIPIVSSRQGPLVSCFAWGRTARDIKKLVETETARIHVSPYIHNARPVSPPHKHTCTSLSLGSHTYYVVLGPNAPPSCFCSQAAIQKKIDKGDLPKDAPMKVPDNAVKENIVSIKPLDVLIEIFEGTAHGQMLNKMLSMGSATFDLKGITLAEVHSRSH